MNCDLENEEYLYLFDTISKKWPKKPYFEGVWLKMTMSSYDMVLRAILLQSFILAVRYFHGELWPWKWEIFILFWDNFHRWLYKKPGAAYFKDLGVLVNYATFDKTLWAISMQIFMPA